MTLARSEWPRWPLLVLAPHPDDDVLGCSRLMQWVGHTGGELVIVWLTDGGASHGALVEDARAALVSRRREEALAGVRMLGVVPQATYFLGIADGTLADHITEARTAVASMCRRHQISSVVVTDRHDGHPDHRAAYAIAMGLGVARVLTYPVSARYDGNACVAPADALQIPAELGDGKHAALLQHRSQMEPQALFPLTLATVERFCAEPEYFIPVRALTREMPDAS